MSMLNAQTEHGGIVVPLDMFRVSQLTLVASEVLVGKARNILDAKIVFTRHPTAQIVLITIDGSVLDGHPAEFWRENADIALAMSQGLRTQCFLYYTKTAPAAERREGFVVAQRGQPLAADDATAANQPAHGEPNWPVTKLCEQLRIQMDDLANGFAGGPRVETSLVEPSVDDQAAIMKLAGNPEGGDLEDEAAAPSNEAGAPSDTPPGPAKPTLADDLKRRAKEKAAEAEALQERAASVQADLQYEIDAVGIVVCPQAELGEPDILAPFIRGKIEGDLPPGLPPEHTNALQGLRSDIAVKVDFLSELMFGRTPLSRPQFEQSATPAKVGGTDVRTMEVLAPRLGYGTLVSAGKAPHVFVSRKSELGLPGDLVARLLQ